MEWFKRVVCIVMCLLGWIICFLAVVQGFSPASDASTVVVLPDGDQNDRTTATPMRNSNGTAATVSVDGDDTDDNDPRCTNVDIRNTLGRLAEIENCTVINGFFHMVLIERVNVSEFGKYQLKKLREVTGYMLFFRVMNLFTLRDLFPNLMVIRGQQLIGNYALVFYFMSNMTEIGLKNLVAIQRGFVYTLHSPLICHLDTIDWATISGLDNSTRNLNSFETPKTVCNKSEVCRGCDPKYCWGSQSCQKFYKGTNFTGRIKCHPQCIGGCNGTTASECLVCRGWKEGKKCVEHCSSDRLLYRPTKRCIAHKICAKRRGLLYKNECVLECPAGYSVTDVYQIEANMTNTCMPCNHRCPKICSGTEIMYLSDADRMTGCTIVNGTLHIRLKEDHPNLLKELENGLGAIEEIMGILKVFRSNYITSLEFLSGLETIHGQYGKERSNFSLMVYENSNLQRLWNFERKTTLRILSRGMYFRNNELLCHNKIKLLRKVAEYNNATDTIDWGSNGYMQSCDVESFEAKAEVLSSRNVTIYWEIRSEVRRMHRLQGYLIYYIRSNVDQSPYEGRDHCSKYGWRSRNVSLENAAVRGGYYAFNLTRLKPFTRYAFYVKTHYNESMINSTTDTVWLSGMHYFKTEIDRPTSPLRVRTARKNASSITLTWQILPSERDMVELYHVDVFIQPDEKARFDQRNYCTHPHEQRTPQERDTMAENSDTCSREFCCELQDLEDDEEEEEEEDEEVTAPDEFFHEQQNAMENGGRIGGRRKKRAVEPRAPVHDDGFEKTMLKFLRADTTSYAQHYRGRVRRESEEEEIEFVNRVFFQNFKTDNYEHTVDGLSPYTRYVFQLFACSKNDSMYCSSYSLYTDRTDPSPIVDRLNVSIIMNVPADEDLANQTIPTTFDDRIVLYFPEPMEVNGLTVAYRVELESLQKTYYRRRTECFTRLEHERRQYRYTFDNMKPGEYLMRAQVISLAGPGPFSERMFMRILEPNPTTVRSGAGNTSLRDGLIACAVLLLLAGLGGCTFWFLRRRRRQRSAHDDKYPLAANDGNQVDLDDGFVSCPLK